MDGFRDRINRAAGRYERPDRTDRYDRADRYERSERVDENGGERYDRNIRGDRMERPALRRSMIPAVTADEVNGIIENSNAKQLEVINDLFEDAKDDRLESEQQIIHAIDELAKAQSTAPVVVEKDRDNGKDEILAAVQGNSSLINNVREILLAREQEQQDEEERAPLDEETALKEDIGKSFKDLEEHVHKENVKCYRNVQATLEEQLKTGTDALRSEIGGLKALAVINLIISIVTLGALIARIFGVI